MITTPPDFNEGIFESRNPNGDRENILRLHQINGPGNFKAEMIFEFAGEVPIDVEMVDIAAASAAEAAALAVKKWGFSTGWKLEAASMGPSASPLQTEWQLWGGEHQDVVACRTPNRPERYFPRHKRFVVRYETSCLTTKGTWTKPLTARAFRLADSAEDALASVQAHLDDPHYFEPGFHLAVHARVETCPDTPAYYDTYCRFDGSNDIRKSRTKPSETSQ